MPNINLLPWREELRAQRQKEFGVMAVLAVLVMAGVVFLVKLQFDAMIDYQNQRNQYLDQEIAKLDKKIAKIKDLEREKQNLLARMRIVERLQTSRPEVVHLFDEMVATLPEGVYLTSLVQKGRIITLDGFAQSNARVSSFMRKLEGSTWLEQPDLKLIQSVSSAALGGVRLSKFKLSVKQTKPKNPEAEEGK